MKVSIILGAGFGDEGKGAWVNYLASQNKKSVVVRFNGGHQVGHTVVVGDTRHVFSNFGSGTLQGVPTYWSEYCTLNPIGIKKEGDALRKIGFEPELIISPNAMVTTPFDILKNHKLEETNKHGSVGVGFGSTIQRNEDHFHLYARDLLFPKVRDEKLRLIIKYYGHNFNPYADVPEHQITKNMYWNFIDACDDLLKRYKIKTYRESQMWDRDLIFEGGQGIMLDMDYGFFPHVTRSHTTSKNVWEFIEKYRIPVGSASTYYITRAYQTRHGNGYMTNDSLDISYIKENPNETNVMGFQGEFRKTPLDLDLLKYAIDCDRYHNSEAQSYKNIVITCLDQVDPAIIPATINGELIGTHFSGIANYCDIQNHYPCFSDKGYNL